MNIIKNTLDQINKPVIGQIRFSDVYPEVEGLQEQNWWQKTDFDARLTDKVESGGFAIFEQIPIGFGSWMVGYGLVLADDLLTSRNQRVSNSIIEHPDFAKEKDQMQNGAVLAMANYAPRDNKNTQKHQNGSDFYLAITESGLEIYATPLSFLGTLEARSRILALYRIPTKGHPEFSGDHEQFRSARIVRSRRHPEHLEPIYEYNSRKELIDAKRAGTHQTPIPVEERTGHIGFVDKFGNIKLELQDIGLVQRLEVGKTATLTIKQDDQSYEFEVKKAEDLRSAEVDMLSVYVNVSDEIDNEATVGLVELIVRVDTNPSTSHKTAIYQIMDKIPHLDPQTATVELSTK